MINRAALIVRPKQPYLDWAAGLDDSGLLPDVEDEQTVYLIPEYAFEADADAIIELVHREVFERELYDWHTDESDWPVKRDVEAFRAWFKIELHSVVEDLCAGAIVEDDDAIGRDGSNN